MELNINKHLESLKANAQDFLGRIEEEGIETKEAFYLLLNSVETGKDLTPEEKQRIGDQLKDVLKTIGVIGVAFLPGGSVFFILSTYFKMNKYFLPSSFQEKN